MIRVLVADDQQLVREGYIALLQRDPGIKIVGEARDGREAVELTRKLLPDVVLLDIQMPVLNGLDAILLMREVKASRILVISMVEEQLVIQEAARRGAAGYITKGQSFRDLTEAIQTIYNGGTYFGDGHSNALRSPELAPVGSA